MQCYVFRLIYKKNDKIKNISTYAKLRYLVHEGVPCGGHIYINAGDFGFYRSYS